MSTRQLLNLALGAVALLLCASLTLVWNQGHGGRITGQQIELAKKQQIVIQDLGRQVAALQKAEDQEAVVAARRSVGQTVLEFDRNLAALAKGAVLTADDGHEISIARIRGGKARRALEDALQMLSLPRVVGAHPDDGADVTVQNGRYGPYVTDGEVNASLPRGTDPETVTLEQAIELIAARKARGPVRRKRTTKKKTAKKRSTKKTTRKTGKKKTTKKAAARKTTGGVAKKAATRKTTTGTAKKTAARKTAVKKTKRGTSGSQ